jgi:serine/threonine protein kinase
MSAKSVVTLTATDQSSVQYVNESPKQGGVKDVYFSPDRSYVVAFYRKEVDAVGHERLERLVDSYRKNIFQREGGEYFKDLYRWPERLVRDGKRTGIVVPIYDSKFFFPSGTHLEGAEKEGYWFTSAKNFNRNIPQGERGDLLGYLKVCIKISRAVKRLHAAGLAHSDLSYKNCLVDPCSGSACIIDIDGLVVPGLFPPDVIGTPDFIAPEVVRTLHLPMSDPARRLPCVDTDLHALAVLVYHYLLHRHPLRGSKVWDHEDQARQESLEMGEKALFIEHPADPTNRRKIGPGDEPFLPWIDTQRLPYTILGPHLGELFLSAFVKRLHEPRLRPTADDWEEALLKTVDLLERCSNPDCPKGWYVFDNTSRPCCPYCNTPYNLPELPFLDLYFSRDGENFRPDSNRITVYDGLYLYPWHVNSMVFRNEKLTQEQRRPMGYFSFYKGRWFFVNQALTSLYEITPDEPKGIHIPPGQGVQLRTGQRLRLSREPGGRLALVTLVRKT